MGIKSTTMLTREQAERRYVQLKADTAAAMASKKATRRLEKGLTNLDLEDRLDAAAEALAAAKDTECFENFIVGR